MTFSPNNHNQQQIQNDQRKPHHLNKSLAVNMDYLKKRIGNSTDVIFRSIKIGHKLALQLTIVYVEGIADDKKIDQYLISTIYNKRKFYDQSILQDTLNKIKDEVSSMGSVKQSENWEDILASLMSGNTIIFVDGIDQAIIANTAGGEKRSIEEPITQVSIRGARDGFIESIRTNTAMVRKRIQNPDLWLETFKIGRTTKTDVAIMYIKGIAKDEIVEEVRRRLKRINIDSILETGYIEQLIEDQTWTPFPTVYHAERPDVVAGNLLEGRVAIFVDGTPFVLLVPAVFIQFFQAVDDYYARFDISSALRFLRVLVFLLSIIVPAFYIAITTFHQEMIPTQLLIVLAAQREAVPFPVFVEAFLMEVAFEILREAGIRLPRPVGQTVSIVGALVIGQAAVQAGIVSPAIIIIVSITAIASFATPSYSIAISARLIRFIFMITASSFGFYGIFLGMVILAAHLCSLRSFGIPYLEPLAPFVPKNAGDTLVRLPLWSLKERPRLIVGENNIREGEHLRPGPPKTRSIRNDKTEGGRKDES